MKFRIAFKDPDGFSESVAEAAMAEVDAIDGLTEDEREALKEMREERLKEFLRKWVEYSEYLTVEFDTEAKTAAVVEQK